jgi:glycosyltransferase involved in cell wall biosynthesis
VTTVGRPPASTVTIGFNARCLEEPHTRGLSRYTACLLRELSRRPDVRLVLFAMTPPHPTHLRNVRARVVCFPGRDTIWQHWLLPRHLRAEGIDIFHAPADRGLPLSAPCPLVVTVHDTYERAHWRRLFPTAKQRGWYWANEAVNRVRADVVLTVSDATRQDLVRRHVVPRHRVETVHLAAADEFGADASPDDERRLAGHGIHRRYLLYVGGYDARKNVDVLVRAFDRANLPDHDLVIVARHDSRSAALVAGWRALACFSRLHTIEAANDDLPAFYRRADLFVNPSRWESFGLQTIEAMACGTPVLASNLAAIAEVAGGAAELVDSTGVEPLATRLRTLAHDAGRLAELRRRGAARAAEFSWRTTATLTLRAYNRALTAHGRPPIEGL